MIGRLQSLLRCCCGHNIHIEKHIRRKHWLRRWRLYIVTCFEIMSKWLTCQCQHLISSGVFFFFFFTSNIKRATHVDFLIFIKCYWWGSIIASDTTCCSYTSEAYYLFHHRPHTCTFCCYIISNCCRSCWWPACNNNYQID